MSPLLKSALADRISFTSGDVEAWRPPDQPPPLDELNAAVAHLEARLIPIRLEDFRTCMQALLNNLAVKDDEGETWEERLGIYFTTLNDVPMDLLEEATLRCIKSETWFPKVAVIRAKIEAEFKLRRNMLARARWLVANRTKPAALPVFVPPPEDVRLREAIERWHRFKDAFFAPALRKTAIEAEIRLADIEGRAPADWAIEQATMRLPPSTDHPPGHTAPATIEGDYQDVTTTAVHDDADAAAVMTTAVHADSSVEDALTNEQRFEEPPPRAGEDLEW